MKKLLLTIFGVVLLSVGLMAQTITPIPAGGTWSTARGIINANDEVASDSMAILQLQKAPLASPTFTGTISLPSTWRINGVTVTSNAAELNILDGALVTFTEINRLVGVTGAIQTQLNSKVNVSDTASMLSPYALISEIGAGTGDVMLSDSLTVFVTPTQLSDSLAGAGVGVSIGDVRSEIADSLNVLRPLYTAVADTADMLDPYALQSYIDAELNDTTDLETLLQIDFDTDTLATRAYVRTNAGVGGDVDLTGDVTIGTDQTNYLRIYSEVYFDTTGVAAADTVALFGIVQGDSLKLQYAPLVDAGDNVSVDSSLYVTITRLSDSLNVMRSLINDLIAVVENLGVDLTAPSIDSLEIGTFADDTLVIYFSEKMNIDSIPASTVFSLTEGGSGMGIASIEFENDSVMYVVLDSAAMYGAVYQLDYTRDHPYLQDSTGNALANFSNRTVTNNFEEPAPPPENMIANGTFAAPASEWTWTSGFSIGSMVHNGIDMYQNFNQEGTDMVTDIAISTSYRLQINVTLSGANPMMFVIQSRDGTVEYGTQLYPCGNGTTTIDFTTTTNIGGGGIRFRFPFEEGGSGTVNWVTLYER